MATSLVTEFQSLAGDSLESELGEVGDEPGMDQMFEETSQEQDFVGLNVDFDFCNDLQLDGVDFPMDIWNSAPSDENLELNQKLGENFNIDEDFNQMLNEWDNQLDSLQSSSGMDEILQTNSRSEETTLEPEVQVQQTVTLKKPNQTNTYRGMITSNQTRQVPLSSALRSPLVTRGVCYTRAGGLGVSRSVQSTGFVNTSPRVTFSSQFTTTSPRPSTEEAPLIYTPVSPIRSPSSSNAPDFFIASTRSTADVVKSNYSRFISQSRSSIITTNPDSANRYGSDHRNSQVKIIASVSPKSDGTSTAKILSSSSIRESLPKELIDKIRAASQGRKTIAIIEPINRRESPGSSDQSQFRSKQTSRFGSAAATLGKWRNVGIIPPFSNNVSDHDYCSPSRASRFSRKYLNAQSKVMRQIEESMCRNKPGRVESPGEEGETKKDSGLESCEMSDASEDGTLYDKLPRYLTNASVQTIESRSVQDDHGYNRLPAYLIKPQQSLLKSNLTRSVAEKHNIVISAIECFDQKPDNYDVKPDISLADPCPPPPAVADNSVRVELQGNNSELSKREGLISTRVPGEENPVNQSSNDKSHLKRRRESVDSSSDSDGSYRRSFKRRRSNYPRDMKVRPSSRERRRRFRGRSRSFSSSPDRRKDNLLNFFKMCKAQLKSCTDPFLYRSDLVTFRRMLYLPDVCNCTMPYVHRTVPAYALRYPA